MKRLSILAVVVAALVLSVAACGGEEEAEQPAAGTGSEEPADQEPIVLGASIALSGWEAPWDDPTFMEMAIEDINAAGGVNGRPFELITCDMKSEIPLSSTCAQEVLDKGADIVIVSCDFDFGAPAALVAQDAGKLAFSQCAASVKFGVQGIGPLAFTTSTPANFHSAMMAEWAYDQGWRNAYILVDPVIWYHKEVCGDYLKTRWAELGGELAGEDTFDATDPSVAPQITRIRSLESEIDGIFLCSPPPGGPAVIRQTREAGVDLPFLGNVAMGGDQYPKASPNLSDFYFVDLASQYGNDETAEINELTERYIAETGNQPTIGGPIYMQYDLIEMVAEAIKKADGSTDGPALAEALESFDGFETTVLGPSTYTPEDHTRSAPMVVMGWQNGESVFLERFMPEKVPSAQFD